MLYKHWEKVYDPKDIDDWRKLEDIGLPIIYQFQKQILYGLLAKYYRTNKGNELHPDNPKHVAAFFEMLHRTMEDLQIAVAYRDENKKTQWYEQRDKDEDLGAKLTREEDLRKDASFKKISLREEVDLGRFWISPSGKAMAPDPDIHHGEWIIQHPEILDTREKGLVDRYKGDIPKLINFLFADGWIRVSGGIAEIYSEHQMYQLAKFLNEHIFDGEKDASIIVLQHDNGREFVEKISDIISKYGDNETLELQASNPLRKNFDYNGVNWVDRVFKRRSASMESICQSIH